MDNLMDQKLELSNKIFHLATELSSLSNTIQALDVKIQASTNEHDRKAFALTILDLSKEYDNVSLNLTITVNELIKINRELNHPADYQLYKLRKRLLGNKNSLAGFSGA